jgi:hypothetical protein
MSETNQNNEPMKSHKHFDFSAFESVITLALKEYSMFPEEPEDDLPPAA